ncbi:hypothetical protein MBLNU459_g0532t1 [Dothideomycetes sp. NU459]
MDLPESPAQSDQTCSPTSLPGRDHLADADSSLIRKRARFTPPDGSDGPIIVEIFDFELAEPDEQPAVVEIMPNDRPEDVLGLGKFPFGGRDSSTPEASAQKLADSFFDDRRPFNDVDINVFRLWLCKHLDETECEPAPELDRLYIDKAPFWTQVARCFDAICQHKQLSPSTMNGVNGALSNHVKVQTLFEALTRLCVRLLRAEVAHMEMVKSRRDSASPLDNSTKHALLFNHYAVILCKLLTGSCSLSKSLSKERRIDRSLLQRCIAIQFASETVGAEAMAQLFHTILENSEQIQNPYSPLRLYLSLIHTLLRTEHNSYINKQSFLQNVARMVSTADAILLPQICKIHPGDLPLGYHQEIVLHLHGILVAMITLGPVPTPPEQAPQPDSKTMEYELAPMETTVEMVNIAFFKDSKAFSELSEDESQRLICQAWYLKALQEYITSGIMTLRLVGLELLNENLVSIWTECNNPGVPDARLHYSVRFLLKNDLTAYLLGPDSHADLIRRCSNSIGFLVVNRCLLASTSDSIWRAVSANQQADIREAATGLLLALVNNMDQYQIMYFCRKYRDLSSCEINIPLLRIFDLLLVHLLSLNNFYASSEISLEAACTCLRILQVASFEDQIPLDRVLVDLVSLVRRADKRTYRLEVLRMCTPLLGQQRSFATGSMLAISVLWKADLFTIRELTEVVPLRDISREISDYIHASREDADAWSSNQLLPRMRLIVSLLASSSDQRNGMTEGEFQDCLKIEKEFWICCLGEHAIDNDARQYAWTAIVENAREPSGFLDRCISEYLPTLKPEHATAGIFALYDLLTGISSEERGFHFPLKHDIIRLALTAPNEALANHAVSTAIKALFTGQALQHPEQVAAEQVAVVENCMEVLHVEAASTTRAISLLGALLNHSFAYEQSVFPAHQSHSSDDPIFVGSTTKENGQELTAYVHHGRAQPMRRPVFIGDSATVADLAIAVSTETGFKEFLVIAGGQVQDLKADPSMTIRERGLLNKGALIIKKTSTPRSVREDWESKTGKTAVERALFERFDELYALLDKADIISEQLTLKAQIFPIIIALPAPKLVRDMVTSPTTVVDEIFPPENIWKTIYSIRILLRQLHEQAIEGVADEVLLLRGVRILVGLLDRFDDSENPIVLKEISHALLSFLRERSVKDESHNYFDSPSRFVANTLAIMDRIQQRIPNETPSESLVGVRSETISRGIKSFVWSIILDSLLDAQKHALLSMNLFRIAPDVLRSDHSITDSEPEMRALVGYLGKALLSIEHDEQFEHARIDYRLSGLSQLLQCSIVCLKLFKQPLQLGDLAVDLFRKFLYPSTSSDAATAHVRPVVTPHSRESIYRLVGMLCEDLRTVDIMISLVIEAVRSADHTQTCYMNSLLQQLFMNVHFRKFIFDTPVLEREKQLVLSEFKIAFAYMQESYGLAYCPDGLARALDVDVTVQDDAHIFFTTLVGKLEDSMPTSEAKKTLRSFFAGSNKSQTKGECGHISESPDEYFNLSLVVKDKNSLQESLDDYVTGSPLEGGDKFKCVTCDPKGEGIYVNAMRRTGLQHVPNNLVLGLKRFQYETYDGGAKVNDRFDFPEEIDMSPYKITSIANPENPVEPDIFQLVGVVVHFGTLQFGHYWLEDSQVIPCTIADVMNETRGGAALPDAQGRIWMRSDSAYVLFYERKSSIEATKDSISLGDPKASSLRTVTPKVSVPTDLRDKIVVDNLNMLQLLSLHAPEHAAFVKNLLLKVEVLTKGQPSTDNVIENKSISMALQQLRLITIHSRDLDCLSDITTLLSNLACTRPYNAITILDSICGSTENYQDFAFSKKQAIRTSANRLIMASLAYLRETHPEFYGLHNNGHIHRIISWHTNLRDNLYQHRFAWSEYLGLVSQIATFGPHETAILLDHGHLAWVVEVLLIPYDQSLQSAYPEIWYHMSHGRKYNMLSLVECIHSLLGQYVDLSDVSSYVHYREEYFRSSGKVLLDGRETGLIRAQTQERQNILLRVACILSSSHAQSSSARRLAVLLTNATSVDKILVNSACNTLELGIRMENEYSTFVAAAKECILSGQMDEQQAFRVARQVALLPTQWIDAECILDFMDALLPVETHMTLQLLPSWVEELLECDDPETEERVLEWTRGKILRREPLKDPPTAENISHTTRLIATLSSVSGKLMQKLKRGHDLRRPQHSFERMITGLTECITWLQNFHRVFGEGSVFARLSLPSSASTDESTSEGSGSDRKSTPPLPSTNAILVEALTDAADDARNVLEQYPLLLQDIEDWSDLDDEGGLPIRDYGPNVEVADDTEAEDDSEEEWEDLSMHGLG